jgi:hypothetical protein
MTTKIVIPPTPDEWRSAVYKVLVADVVLARREIPLDALATASLIGAYLGGAYDIDAAELAEMYEHAIRAGQKWFAEDRPGVPAVSR